MASPLVWGAMIRLRSLKLPQQHLSLHIRRIECVDVEQLLRELCVPSPFQATTQISKVREVFNKEQRRVGVGGTESHSRKAPNRLGVGIRSMHVLGTRRKFLSEEIVAGGHNCADPSLGGKGCPFELLELTNLKNVTCTSRRRGRPAGARADFAMHPHCGPGPGHS